LAVIVRDFHPDRIEAIKGAVRAVLMREELDEDLPPLAEVEDAGGRCLCSRSNPERPVIITGAYEWAMRVETALREAATSANGGPCRTGFEWDDADEGRDDIDDEDE
jgi:hypothetical protein